MSHSHRQDQGQEGQGQEGQGQDCQDQVKERARKLVVAGLILEGEKILISQRMATQAMPLKWEFPGGKIETGESPEAALRRELLEELGVQVRVGTVWDVLFHRYPEFDLLMLIYVCCIEAGEPSCCEVADLAWVSRSELAQYAILEADLPLVRRLEREGLPPMLIARPG